MGNNYCSKKGASQKFSSEALRSNPPQNMSVAEGAWYLGICDTKVRQKIATGELKHARLGRRIILRRCDLDEYVESLVCA